MYHVRRDANIPADFQTLRNNNGQWISFLSKLSKQQQALPCVEDPENTQIVSSSRRESESVLDFAKDHHVFSPLIFDWFAY
jgi:hypothetical protein